jgi:hypothetical protein
MKNYKHAISDKILNNLKTFIGYGLHQVYFSQGAEYRFSRNQLETSKLAFSIREKSEFIVVRSDWAGDTEKNALDCHKLEIEFSKDVDFLSVDPLVRKGTEIREIKTPSSALLYDAEQKILSIEILQLFTAIENESVDYDSAIIFNTQNEHPVVVYCVEGIQGGVIVQVSKSVSAELRLHARERVLLK